MGNNTEASLGTLLLWQVNIQPWYLWEADLIILVIRAGLRCFGNNGSDAFGWGGRDNVAK